MPALTISEAGGHIRLQLGTVAHGEGSTLQEAADDLICAILRVVMAFCASGFRVCPELRPDLETLDFLYRLGEIAASGEDIREHVFALPA
jgi:hypothetical protein